MRKCTDGNPKVMASAKAQRKAGGKVIGKMHGGDCSMRLDRPGRKTGGAVGANASPLSTASKASSD